MRFGIFYEHQLPRPWGADAEHRLLKDALDQVELADRLGFDYVWAVEHHFLEEYSHSSAPEVFLAAASQRTSRIRIGHGIVQLPVAFNHPARVAERIATLDLVSDGRVEFGTGEQNQFTNNSPATYSTSQQYLIGIWDWNMSAWNALSTVQYDSLPSGSTAAPIAGSGLAAVSGLGQLEQQQISGTYDNNSVASTQTSTSATGAYYRTVTSNVICWADLSGCSGVAGQYGWYLALVSGYANQYDPNFPTISTSTNAQTVYEQIIFNPTLQDGTFIVNTTIPPTTTLATCSATSAGGWTMAINPATGGAFTNSFFGNANHNFLNINNQAVSGIALNGTGSPSVVAAGTNTYVVTQTIGGTGTLAQINPPGGTQGSRLTWIEKR